jgi:hypothetical protein
MKNGDLYRNSNKFTSLLNIEKTSVSRNNKKGRTKYQEYQKVEKKRKQQDLRLLVR